MFQFQLEVALVGVAAGGVVWCLLAVATLTSGLMTRDALVILVYPAMGAALLLYAARGAFASGARPARSRVLSRMPTRSSGTGGQPPTRDMLRSP